MSFSPTITHQSKIIPGLKFTVRRMGFGRRVDLDFKTLELRQRLRELEVENPPQTDREKEVGEHLAIARRKALAVPEEEFEGVMANDVQPLLAEMNGAADIPTRKRRAALAEEYSVIELKVRSHWIREGLVSVEHKLEDGSAGDYDGINAADLLESGDPALALEIFDALSKDGKLVGEDAKNLSSPTISGAQVGGETGSITAPIAEVPQPATT